MESNDNQIEVNDIKENEQPTEESTGEPTEVKIEVKTEPTEEKVQSPSPPKQSPTTASPTTTAVTAAAAAAAIATTTSTPVTSQINLSSLVPNTSALINQPKKTIQIEILENRIKNDVYDTEAWTLLLGEIQSQPIDNCRAIYERFLSHFPTAGKYWKVYAEQEMLAKNYEAVEKLFLRSLKNVRNVELWKTYITYIRQCKTNKEEIVKAFEYALEFIGMDISSTPIWLDYLAFLKEEKTSGKPVEEGAKMVAIRKLYQRAIENPMHDLEQIWKDYDAFENAQSKQLAKSLLSDHIAKYQNARHVYRERKSLLEGILRNMLAKPPTSKNKEEHQVKLWRKLLIYEKSNPQKFDQVVLRNRVAATYSQCLLCLYHYPDMWYEAAIYQIETGNTEGSNQFFDRALLALPKSLFLHFAYADSLESQKKTATAKELYEKLVAQQPVDPLVWVIYMRFARRTERISGPREIFKRARAAPDCTYHVYIALGLIEYYVNQDPKMARDIFELGLKKFPLEMPYINFYIEFLKNLNEENNTRVLFEKLVALPNHEKSSIDSFWRKYLDFEYRQNQDIQTILKLEKRYQAVNQLNRPHLLDKSGALQAFNRYKFLNLSPCNPNEMEVISKNLILQNDLEDSNGSAASGGDSTGPGSTGASANALTTGGGGKQSKKHKKDKHATEKAQSKDTETSTFTESSIIPISTWKVKRPDVSAMAPYRVELGGGGPGKSGGPSGSGNVNISSPISRGQWEIPDFLYPLLQMLPPASAYQGPFVDVDFLLKTLVESNLPISNPNMGGMGNILSPQPMLNNPMSNNSPNIMNSPMSNIQPQPFSNSPLLNNVNNQQAQPQIPSQPPQSSTQTSQQNPLKRKLEEDEPPPQPAQSYNFSGPKSSGNDIYRKRQASKLSKK